MYSNDLNVYDVETMAWTELSSAVAGTPPTRRFSHGFTAAEGKIYVHGGYGLSTSGETGCLLVEIKIALIL